MCGCEWWVVVGMVEIVVVYVVQTGHHKAPLVALVKLGCLV